MEQLQKWLESTSGKVAGVILSIAVIGICLAVVRSSFRSETPDTALSATYIDTATGKPFVHFIKEGEVPPILAPSGQNTGVQAEPCFWTASGDVKTDPTWVALNDSIGKSGPTFCPDCGRLVVGHNPQPVPGMKPPPTEQEYMARRSSQQYAPPPIPSRDSRTN
jgi:hypothetical protein